MSVLSYQTGSSLFAKVSIFGFLVHKGLIYMVTLIQKSLKVIIKGPPREKTCLRWFANNKGVDQPAHTRSLISAFVIRLL